MKTTTRTGRSHRRARVASAHGQRGTYAIEFAFVFLLFYALLYATLCYGVMFAMRSGLQHAAEDGARAGLRYQNVAAGSDPMPLRRAAAAQAAALKVAGWSSTAPVVVAQVCQPATANCTNPVCGPTWTQRCQMVVTVTATGMDRLMPMLHFALPDRLVGHASLLLDGRSP